MIYIFVVWHPKRASTHASSPAANICKLLHVGLVWGGFFKPQTTKLTSLSGCTYCRGTGWNFGMGFSPGQVTEFTNKHDFMVMPVHAAAVLGSKF